MPAPARPGMAIRPAAAAAAAADGIARGAKAPCTLGTERPAGRMGLAECGAQSPQGNRSCPSSCKQRRGGVVGASAWPPALRPSLLLRAHHTGLTTYMCQQHRRLRLLGCRIEPGGLGRACTQVPVTMQAACRAEEQAQDCSASGCLAPRRDTQVCSPSACRSAYQAAQNALLGAHPFNHRRWSSVGSAAWERLPCPDSAPRRLAPRTAPHWPPGKQSYWRDVDMQRRPWGECVSTCGLRNCKGGRETSSCIRRG